MKLYALLISCKKDISQLQVCILLKKVIAFGFLFLKKKKRKALRNDQNNNLLAEKKKELENREKEEYKEKEEDMEEESNEIESELKACNKTLIEIEKAINLDKRLRDDQKECNRHLKDLREDPAVLYFLDGNGVANISDLRDVSEGCREVIKRLKTELQEANKVFNEEKEQKWYASKRPLDSDESFSKSEINKKIKFENNEKENDNNRDDNGGN